MRHRWYGANWHVNPANLACRALTTYDPRREGAFMSDLSPHEFQNVWSIERTAERASPFRPSHPNDRDSECGASRNWGGSRVAPTTACAAPPGHARQFGRKGLQQLQLLCAVPVLLPPPTCLAAGEPEELAPRFGKERRNADDKIPFFAATALKLTSASQSAQTAVARQD